MEEFARALRVSTATLQDYEEDGRQMPADKLAAACTFLKLPLSLLFYEDGSAPATGQAGPWYSLPRPPKLLAQPEFAEVVPALRAWQSRRGYMDRDLMRSIAQGRLMPRAMLARRRQGSSFLIYEHFSPMIALANPCETFTLIGRDIAELPDHNYGGWVAASYERTSYDRAIRIESVLADIRTSRPGEPIVRSRYDRVLIPWYGAGADTFVLCLSLLRRRLVGAN